MAEPRWLERLVLDTIHCDQIREHGGRHGVRDAQALQSTLDTTRRQWRSDGPSEAEAKPTRETADVPALAAAYAARICRDRPYQDGNRRVALLGMAVFLRLNGVALGATEVECAAMVRALAAGEIAEEELAEWIRRNAGASHRQKDAVTPSRAPRRGGS